MVGLAAVAVCGQRSGQCGGGPCVEGCADGEIEDLVEEIEDLRAGLCTDRGGARPSVCVNLEQSTAGEQAGWAAGWTAGWAIGLPSVGDQSHAPLHEAIIVIVHGRCVRRRVHGRSVPARWMVQRIVHPALDRVCKFWTTEKAAYESRPLVGCQGAAGRWG